MEAAASLGFLILGIAFFMAVIHYVVSDSNRSYERMLNERREFGYRFKSEDEANRKPFWYKN